MYKPFKLDLLWAQLSTFFSFLSTPLHHAAYGGYLDIVQLFIEKNATNGIKDYYGTDAYDLAVANGHEEVANYLENN